MCYGAQVWEFVQYDNVESCLRYYIKKLMWAPNHTPNYMLFLEYNRLSIFEFTLRLNFNYILKILSHPDHKLPKFVVTRIGGERSNCGEID